MRASGAESPEISSPIRQEVSEVLGRSSLKSAFEWFRLQEDQFCDWQFEMAGIPAPPFRESARAQWLVERFRELGLEDVRQDSVGNVLGVRYAANRRCVTVSAHIDTVFPEGTPVNIRREGSRLYGPGVSDNGAGVAAMLAIAGTLAAAKIDHQLSILFVGNVGEEGEGDLRGMRHLFSDSLFKDLVAHSLVLDGAGSDTIVSEALGSRRFEVTVHGPGGHSWSDFGAPNPIAALAGAIHAFSQMTVPASPKTTFNIGVIRGGTSVNSIPESASMRVDIRSSSTPEMDRLEAALRDCLSSAVNEELSISQKRAPTRSFELTFDVVGIGNRPTGELNPDARILQVIRAVDAELGNAATIQRASTDANIPLSLGREAIAIGGGGAGGGVHTLQEWFDCEGREAGLKRILLALLVLAGVMD